MPKKKQEAPSVFEVENYHHQWKGYRWSDTGRFLITPEGDRITPERLRGLLWRDHMELKLSGLQSRNQVEKNKVRNQKVKVLVVNLGDFRDKHFGRAAG